MPAEIGAMDPNSYKVLLRRLDAATLTWRGPSLMRFARAACAIAAQALVAVVFALRSSSTPWHDAEPWLPVYGTLIDAGCLALLWWLTRREGIGAARSSRLRADASRPRCAARLGGWIEAAGLSTRAVAFVAAGEMAVGYWMVHAPVSFYPVVNHGDLAILLCFVFLLFVFAGPGTWSLDGLLTRGAQKSA